MSLVYAPAVGLLFFRIPPFSGGMPEGAILAAGMASGVPPNGLLVDTEAFLAAGTESAAESAAVSDAAADTESAAAAEAAAELSLGTAVVEPCFPNGFPLDSLRPVAEPVFANGFPLDPLRCGSEPRSVADPCFANGLPTSTLLTSTFGASSDAFPEGALSDDAKSPRMNTDIRTLL